MRTATYIFAALVLLITLSAAACAQSLRYGVTLDATDGKIAPMTTFDLATFTDVFGTGKHVSLFSFAGARVEDGGLFGGFALATPIKFSNEWNLFVGPYAQFAQGRALSGGLFLGFAARL